MYRLEFTSRARSALAELPDEAARVVGGALAQLEMNPRDLRFWTSGQDDEALHIFAGNRDEWKITYTVAEGAGIVFVHSIRKRRTLAFDPRE